MITITVNEDKNIQVPVCWEECNTHLFQRIVKEWEPDKLIDERNKVLLFSILSGTDFKQILLNTDDNLELAIYQCVAFVYNQPMSFKQEKPDVIKVDGKLIRVPRKLSSMTIEQNMHLRKAISQAKHLEELISLACAVYLQPLVSGPGYDHQKAMDLEKEILELPIWQTFPVGFFFLKKLNNSGSSGRRSLNQRLHQLWRKGTRSPSIVIPSGLRASVTCQSSTGMQRPTVFYPGR